MEIEDKVKSLIEKEVEKEGYLIDSVTYKDGNLTIVIDKQGIVDIDDCVTVTHIVNPILDKADIIEESYVLDICSKEKGSE